MPETRRAPIALAMDTTDVATAQAWAAAVAPHLSTVKIGLELYLGQGPAVVERIRSAAPGIDIFLDLKLHDIPNTVAGAARAVADLAPRYLTVHALGGPAMIRAAADAVPGVQVAAVTLLTSHTDDEVARLGIAGPMDKRVISLATMAVDAGARAIVCSPKEVRALREHLGSDVDLITPGVRPIGAEAGDQRRVATPEAAMHDGATLLVIGRPITGGFAQGGVAAVSDAAAALADAVNNARGR